MTYTYSDAGDLATLNHNMSGSSNDAQFTLTYTAAHQLASTALNKTTYLWQATGTCTDTYTHNDLNQYATLAWCGGTAANATSDANGNMTNAVLASGGPAWTYSYDAENRMMSAAATGAGGSYSYDILDHRSSKLVSAAYTMFLGDAADEEIAEYKHVSDGGSPDWTPALLRRFVPGPGVDQPIAMVDVTSGSAVRTYFHVDRLGSVIAMSIAAAGKTEGPYTYDPYGNLCGSSGAPGCSIPGGVPFKFTGRRFDPETGLYYYRARYMSPQLGRFLQTDSIGYQDDVNLYIYVADDPTDKTDPTGKFLLEAAIGAGINMAVEGGLMFTEHMMTGKTFSAGEVTERLAVAGGTGFVAGLTGVGVVGVANRALKLARLVRSTTNTARAARAAIRTVGQSVNGAQTAGVTDIGRQLHNTGTIDMHQFGDSVRNGAIAAGAFGAAKEYVSSAAQSVGSTTAAAQMANINNTAGRYTLLAGTVASAAGEAANEARPCSSTERCSGR